ncbi:MAG: hypothetical protein IKJ34_02055 [Mailhella sp.]|nr:hypothetical protein [Mailhella sp.]
MKVHTLLAGLAAALMLTGCAGEGFKLKNPFAQPSLTESYVSQFRDVPIPAPMKSMTNESYVTIGHDGGKIGLESFEGRVTVESLANIMMQNMARSGWQLRGSSAGMRSIQLYQKEPHYAVIFYNDGAIYSDMDIWVVNNVGVDIMTLVPEARNTMGGLGTSVPFNTPSSYSSPASDQVTSLPY